MGQELTKSISDALKAMEQGTFQSFCLAFLPFLSPDYNGLERHGATADGKTRKGTPDLIKTFDNGQQIAVECSVENTYWKAPKDVNKYLYWKPCQDVDKCLAKLNNLQEIVLCSNQEIPNKAPNTKADIISYVKNKTNAKITPLCCADIENVLANNTENLLFDFLFQKYFSGVYAWISVLREAQATKLAVELYNGKSLPLNTVLAIANEAIAKYGDFGEAKKFALKQVKEIRSNFERDTSPEPGDVVRGLPEDFPLLKPIGTIQTLLGIPKIGKTLLVAQCANQWKAENINIHWFDCPIEKTECTLLTKDILRSVWDCFLPSEQATELVEGRINKVSLNPNQFSYKWNVPTIYILDNAELLLPEAIKLLCEDFSQLKSLLLIQHLGFIFISNKKLQSLCHSISNEFSAPAWNSSELKELLSKQLPDCDYLQNDKHLSLLEVKSSGHPQLTLALARKFPTAEQLLFSDLKAPLLADEELTKEVENLLFEDILADSDSQQYVFRLSPLIFKAKQKIIGVLAKNITPVISKPFALILDKLSGTVIEGNEKQGYGVSSIYKKIAEEKLSQTEKKEIYDIVSAELLKPEGKIIDSLEVTEGVFYALLSGNLERTFFWTGMLLNSALKEKISKDQVRCVIDRLEFVSFLNPPTDLRLLSLYYTTLFSMAMACTYIENNEKAIDMLKKVKLPLGVEEGKELEDHLVSLCEIAKLYEFLLMAKRDPGKSKESLLEININIIGKFLPDGAQDISDLLSDMPKTLTIKQMPKNSIREFIGKADLKNEKILINLLNMALALGGKAYNEKIDIVEINAFLPSGKAITEILQKTIQAQYNLQKEEPRMGLTFIQQAIILCQKYGFWSRPVENIFSLVRGDTCYKMKSNKNAKISYLRSIKCLGDNIKTFNFAWANYRLGLLSDIPIEAERYFGKASPVFDMLKCDEYCGRSEGERGVALVELRRPLEFIKIAEWMYRRYYLHNKTKLGPAVTIAISQITRLRLSIEKEPLPEEKGKLFPEFKRGFYGRVLEDAKPAAGGIPSFFLLAETYGLLGNTKRKTRCLRTALHFRSANDIDKAAEFLTIERFLAEIIPDGNAEEIKETMIRGIFIKSSDARFSREKLSFCVFSRLDHVLFQLDISRRKKFISLLTTVESIVRNSRSENTNWWLAEICFRKAKLNEDIGTEEERHRLWKTAYEEGLLANNNSVIIESTHQLGFKYYEFSGSIKVLAEIHFALVSTISSQNRELDKLETVGSNLFNFWRTIDFWVIAVSDYKAKETLLDGARSLCSIGLSSKDAAPVMILLLSSIYSFKGPAVDWAMEKIINIKASLPKNIQSHLTFYETTKN